MLEINQVYNMDCAEGLKLLDDECIDLTVTSPPYDNMRDYKGYTFDFDTISEQLFRVTKKGGVVVWVVGDETTNGSESGTSFRQALHFMSLGFNLHDTMIYQKNGAPFPETNRYYQNFEYMFVFSKGSPKTVNLIADRLNTERGKKVRGTVRGKDGILVPKRAVDADGAKRTNAFGVRFNIWKYDRTGASIKDRYIFEHPAMFPEKLADDHIVSWSKEGDLVLDPFMGSGTVAKMAKGNNRNYIGFEISEEYCKIIEHRVDSKKFREEQIAKGIPVQLDAFEDF